MTFEDAFIVHKGKRFKLKSYNVEYTIPGVLEIDLSRLIFRHSSMASSSI